jgi:hypothetical protein
LDFLGNLGRGIGIVRLGCSFGGLLSSLLSFILVNFAGCVRYLGGREPSVFNGLFRLVVAWGFGSFEYFVEANLGWRFVEEERARGL